MGASVKVQPATIVVRKGLSYKGGLRAFSAGTALGCLVGFAGGFTLAQSLYSDENERKAVKRTMKVTAIACGGAVLLGSIGTLLASRA